MEAWAKSGGGVIMGIPGSTRIGRADLMKEQRMESHCSNTKVAVWRPRSGVPNKNVWHAARNGLIACILLSGKKTHGHLGDFFAALKKRERRAVERRGATKQRIAPVGAIKVSPPRRAV